MSSSSFIRPAQLSDIPQLEKLVNSAYRGDSSRKGWTTEADLLDGIRTSTESLSELLQQPDSLVLLFEQDNQLIGCVSLQKQRHQLYLGMLTVAPDLQAKGIGKQLLFASEKTARDWNCSAITMTVISVREELIAWYRRHGYTPTGERKPFPDDPKFGIMKQPLEFIVLEKKLAYA